MFTREKAIECVKLILVISMLGLGLFTSAPSEASGLLLYEFGRADVGLAYDPDFQDSSDVSPLLPLNSAWRFGAGAQHQPSENFFWGFSAEYLNGGTLDTNLKSTRPVALGGRGNLIGSYNSIGTIFLGLYANWKF